MPLYSVTPQAGVLRGEAKVKLAGSLTTFHSEYSGVPKNWVHVVFHDYAPGSGFTAGEPSPAAALRRQTRERRLEIHAAGKSGNLAPDHSLHKQY